MTSRWKSDIRKNENIRNIIEVLSRKQPHLDADSISIPRKNLARGSEPFKPNQ